MSPFVNPFESSSLAAEKSCACAAEQLYHNSEKHEQTNMRRRRLCLCLLVILTAVVSLSTVVLRPEPFHSLSSSTLQGRQPLGAPSVVKASAKPVAVGNKTLKQHQTHRHRKSGQEEQGPVATPMAYSTAAVGNNMTTYDDIIQSTLDTKHYIFPRTISANSGGGAEGNHVVDIDALSPFHQLCDDVTVPFTSEEAAGRCTTFMAAVMTMASTLDPRSTNTFHLTCAMLHQLIGPGRQPVCDEAQAAAVTVEPMQQKFEQRTIKFKVSIHIDHPKGATANKKPDGNDDAGRGVASPLSTSWILKVPQVLFPIEPFAEVAAYHIDRKVKINRIPPTQLVALPIAWIRQVSLSRTERKMPMVQEFLVASDVKSFDEWIDKDFVHFLQSESSGKYVANKTHAWCSVQLFMREVQPILYSTLRVPYSKSNPGWHRWFDVAFSEYPVPVGSLLALSELAVFDFIIRNNDRSPNKNNFIVGACKKCWPRRPSGTVPTLIHLDHGMSFYGPSTHTVHNPLSKSKEKLKFCIFYKPMVTTLRAMSAQLLRHNLTTSSSSVDMDETLRSAFADVKGSAAQKLSDVWQQHLSLGMPRPAVRAIGESKLECGSQVVKVLARVETCIRLFNESAVLRP